MGLHDGGQSRHLEGNGESGTVMLGFSALAQLALAQIVAPGVGVVPPVVPSPPVVPAPGYPPVRVGAQDYSSFFNSVAAAKIGWKGPVG